MGAGAREKAAAEEEGLSVPGKRRQEFQPDYCALSSVEQRRVRGMGTEAPGCPNPAPLLDLKEVQGVGVVKKEARRSLGSHMQAQDYRNLVHLTLHGSSQMRLS